MGIGGSLTAPPSHIARLEASDADYGVTDCPTCRLQMEELGTKVVRHPAEVLGGSLEKG